LSDIFEIEKKFKKELEQLPEWSYLRNYYREAQTYTVDGRNSINKKEIIKQAFYGFKNWFKRYDYIIFSNSSARKHINDKFFDIRSDFLAEVLGQNRTLIVETPTTSHIKQDLIYTKHIVSKRLLDILSLFVEKIYNEKFNIPILNEINSFINIDFDYASIIKRFNSRYRIYRIWLKIIKPKIIFLNCYYDKQYIIRAAKDLNITTVDIQHGLIGKNHSAYYSNINLDKSYLPDYLLAFGEYDKENIAKGNIFDEKNIFLVGNYYLEYLRKNFVPDEKFSNILKRYKISVGVSLQWTVENKMINFINEVAKKTKDVIFVLIPREYKDEYNNLNLENNVIFYPKLDCYQIVMHCNFHATVYSTCAIEAFFLGVPNIFVNIDGLTDKYLKDFYDNNVAYIVNHKDEFVDILQSRYLFKTDEVKKIGEHFFIKNYKTNLVSVIKKIKKGYEK